MTKYSKLCSIDSSKKLLSSNAPLAKKLVDSAPTLHVKILLNVTILIAKAVEKMCIACAQLSPLKISLLWSTRKSRNANNLWFVSFSLTKCWSRLFTKVKDNLWRSNLLAILANLSKKWFKKYMSVKTQKPWVGNKPENSVKSFNHKQSREVSLKWRCFKIMKNKWRKQ